MRLKYRYRLMLRRVRTFRWRRYGALRCLNARTGRDFRFILEYRT